MKFDIALFTNLTRDHLDYHKTMAAYGAAKAKLFTWPGLRTAVINADDAFGQSLIDAARARGQRLLTYGFANADIAATAITMDGRGIVLDVTTPWGKATLTSTVVGAFNAQNLLGVLGVLLATDVPLADATAALGRLAPPEGRMQRLGGDDKPLVVVDYAHTPDALEKVLLALEPAVAEGRELVCVFGCGGDRDPGKRPQMGAIAGRLADRVVVTSDNPRSEDPEVDRERGRQGDSRDAQSPLVDRERSPRGDCRRDRNRESRRRRADRRQGTRDVPGAQSRTHAVLGRFGIHGGARRMERRMMDTATAARVLAGRLVGDSVRFLRVTTDSRALREGDLFVALKGERFDGHDFVPAALAQGAAAALVAHDRAPALPGALVAVADPLAALGQLAAYWRAQFTLPLVAIVGSNGKTTVKEMLAAILRAEMGAADVLATTGNLNNAIGVPLTLLRLTAAHRAAIVELGMNHRGETRELAAIAQPTHRARQQRAARASGIHGGRVRSGSRARRRHCRTAARRRGGHQRRRCARGRLARRCACGGRARRDLRARSHR